MDQIKIFPNPSDKSITISYDSALLKNISIVAMDGKLMLNQDVSSNQKEIDVSGFAKGIYLISVQTNDGKILKNKFIKN